MKLIYNMGELLTNQQRCLIVDGTARMMKIKEEYVMTWFIFTPLQKLKAVLLFLRKKIVTVCTNIRRKK